MHIPSDIPFNRLKGTAFQPTQNWGRRVSIVEHTWGMGVQRLKSNAVAYRKERKNSNNADVIFTRVNPRIIHDRLFREDVIRFLKQNDTVYIDCGLLESHFENDLNLHELNRGNLEKDRVFRDNTFLNALEIIPNGEFNYGDTQRASEFAALIRIRSSGHVEITSNIQLMDSPVDGKCHLFIKLENSPAPSRVADSYKGIGETFDKVQDISGSVENLKPISVSDFQTYESLAQEVFAETRNGSVVALTTEGDLVGIHNPQIISGYQSNRTILFIRENREDDLRLNDSAYAVAYELAIRPNAGTITLKEKEAWETAECVHDYIDVRRASSGIFTVEYNEESPREELAEKLKGMVHYVLSRNEAVSIEFKKEDPDSNFAIFNKQDANSVAFKELKDEIESEVREQYGDTAIVEVINGRLLLRVANDSIFKSTKSIDQLSKMMTAPRINGKRAAKQIINTANELGEFSLVGNPFDRNDNVVIRHKSNEYMFLFPEVESKQFIGELENNLYSILPHLISRLSHDHYLSFSIQGNNEQIGTFFIHKNGDTIELVGNDLDTSEAIKNKYLKVVSSLVSNGITFDVYSVSQLVVRRSDSDPFKDAISDIQSYVEQDSGIQLEFEKVTYASSRSKIVPASHTNLEVSSAKWLNAKRIRKEAQAFASPKTINFADGTMIVRQGNNENELRLELEELPLSSRSELSRGIERILSKTGSALLTLHGHNETIRLAKSGWSTIAVVTVVSETGESQPLLDTMMSYLLSRNYNVELCPANPRKLSDIDAVRVIRDIANRIGKTIKISPRTINSRMPNGSYKLKAARVN